MYRSVLRALLPASCHLSPVVRCLLPAVVMPVFLVARGVRATLYQFQWVVFHCESRTVSMLDEFSPRQFFLKMYLPYFDMFAQGFTPWSPDGKSFAYVAADAAFVQEVNEAFLVVVLEWPIRKSFRNRRPDHMQFPRIYRASVGA